MNMEMAVTSSKCWSTAGPLPVYSWSAAGSNIIPNGIASSLLLSSLLLSAASFGRGLAAARCCRLALCFAARTIAGHPALVQVGGAATYLAEMARRHRRCCCHGQAYGLLVFCEQPFSVVSVCAWEPWEPCSGAAVFGVCQGFRHCYAPSGSMQPGGGPLGLVLALCRSTRCSVPCNDKVCRPGFAS